MSLIHSVYDSNALQIDVSDMKTAQRQFRSFSNHRLNDIVFTGGYFCAIVLGFKTTFKALLEKWGKIERFFIF